MPFSSLYGLMSSFVNKALFNHTHINFAATTSQLIIQNILHDVSFLQLAQFE